MSQKWIPISTDLKENGSFMALSHLKNSNDLKPIPLENGFQYSEFTIKQDQIDVNVALKMGLFNFFKLDVTSKIFTFLYEASIYADVVTTIPVGDIIFGTRYGTGYRIMLKVANFDANTSVSITSIAAQASLGKASVQFELHGFGFPDDASILADAPNPADFNIDTWVRICEYTTKVKEYLHTNIASLSPKPYQIMVEENKIIDNTYEFQSYLYAYKCIMNRTSLKRALEQAHELYNPMIIREVYKSLNIIGEATIPTKDQAESAGKIVNLTR
jgi:hypothetical protein